METDNKLLKEFASKDVNRLRNLQSGRFGDATTSQVGYSKKEVDHKEGDVWKEGDKEWTIKDGIKQTNTKLDGIRKMFGTPMLCPCCGNRMKDKLDKKMYSLHNKCFSCIQAEETKMKIEGTYEAYAMGIMKANANTFIQEAQEYISEIDRDKVVYYSEDGSKEDYTGPNTAFGIKEKMQQELDDLKTLINTSDI
jgi:bacterioferritin-associated ferredoxin